MPDDLLSTKNTTLNKTELYVFVEFILHKWETEKRKKSMNKILSMSDRIRTMCEIKQKWEIGSAEVRWESHYFRSGSQGRTMDR